MPPSAARLGRNARTAMMLALVALAGCAPRGPQDGALDLDAAARAYVLLALGLGEHDAAYVDAYYGPEGLRRQATERGASVEELREEAARLGGRLDAAISGLEDPDARWRAGILRGQLTALVARADLLSGVPMTFDEESLAVYDAVAPRYDEAHFREALAALDGLLPGKGSVPDRHEAYRAAFVVPEDRLDAVFRAAIDECRRRTAARVGLPERERFELEYVVDKPWSGYNWYRGGYESLIQLNVELPVQLDRAVDLACHEGYPGHHAFNALIERHLVEERGLVEFSIYPLFSPLSLVAEGTANFGIEVAFPGRERLAFERDVLFPLAGIDPAEAERYAEVRALADRLAYAGNDAARRYLDGEIDAGEAERWLRTYALMPEERAAQRVRFFDAYRAYVINYNLGEDLVRAWIEARGGTEDRPERRWELFAELLSRPRRPSELARASAR